MFPPPCTTHLQMAQWSVYTRSSKWRSRHRAGIFIRSTACFLPPPARHSDRIQTRLELWLLSICVRYATMFAWRLFQGTRDICIPLHSSMGYEQRILHCATNDGQVLRLPLDRRRRAAHPKPFSCGLARAQALESALSKSASDVARSAHAQLPTRRC